MADDITASETVDLGTASASGGGDVMPSVAMTLPPPGRIIRFPAATARAGVANIAVPFSEPADPTDVVDYMVDVTDLLTAPEAIVDYDAIIAPESAGVGLQIGTGPRAPRFSADRKSMLFWVLVNPANHGANAYRGAGTPVAIELTFYTSNDPARTIQRTVTIQMRQR